MEKNDLNKPFTFLLRVRYCECDAQNVVFNARYGDYVDTASTEFFRAMFGDYQSLLNQGLDCQVVKLTTEWKSSAKFDDVLEISVETSHVGNSSFAYSLVFKEHTSRRLIATSEIIYVMVDANTFSKTPIPTDIKNTLGKGATGVLANQAGIDL